MNRSPLRVVIVDDEEAARRGLRLLLRDIPGVEVLEECANGVAALEAIERLAPHLVFLDIQMPELDGFGVIERLDLEQAPIFVFVTAFDEYAIRAFDVHAVDYLLKPFSAERLGAAVARARAMLDAGEAREFRRRLLGVLAEAGISETEPPDAGSSDTGRFLVRSRGRVVFVAAEEIDWVEAVGDYVRLYTARGSHLTRLTMSEAEERLAPHDFVRIHRSTLVRLPAVLEVKLDAKGRPVAVLSDGAERRVSGTGRDRLDSLLGRL